MMAQVDGHLTGAAAPQAGPLTGEDAGGICKPSVDSREYRVINLPNGVRFVLAQDGAAEFAAAAINVNAGYMNDPSDVPGLAHFLEHAVHLGSEAWPEEGEYKAFLARHAGASNASTGMVHTVYHFSVHHDAAAGALERLGACLTAPLIPDEAVGREVHNVHAEFSRNCNSDARKLLQLKRSANGGRYGQFSTGNLTTLWDRPGAQGMHVAGLLRAFWDAHYTAGRTTGCVVAPQPLAEQEAWVRAAFAGMRAAQTPANDALPPPIRDNTTRLLGDVPPGRLLRVSPQRQAMRTLQVVWRIPHSSLAGSWRACKPWRFAGHLLGHEGPGSLAAALKAQGLLTDLDVGVGDEVQQEPGFMFWTVTMQLTEAGLPLAGQLVVALHHALAVIRSLPDAQRRAIYEDAAKVAALRWEYADRTDPREAARSLAHRLHYWPAEQLLSGSNMLQGYDADAVDEFLAYVVPSNLLVVICADDAAGAAPSVEPWYGARYTQQALPQELMEACTAVLGGAFGPTPVPLPRTVLPGSVPLAGSDTRDHEGLGGPPELVLPPLHPPGPNWALPVDTSLLASAAHGARNAPATGASPDPPTSTPAATPCLVVDTPQLKMWHALDTSWRLPKAHLHVHLLTPVAYASPTARVTARLLCRLLDDLLQPEVYDAQLLGASCALGCHESGLWLEIQGFSSVIPGLLRRALEGLRRLGTDLPHVAARHGVVAGRVAQQLRMWRHNNPLQHAEYGAEHLLQTPHWHVNDYLAALLEDPEGEAGRRGSVYREAVGPPEVCTLASALSSDLHVEALCYGNVSAEGAVALADVLRELLQPAGLQGVGALSRLGAHVLRLQPPGVQVRLIVPNPNPSNTNSALIHLCQVCDGLDQSPAAVRDAVLLSLLVQMSSKRCFHALRTQQRLGYVVSLSTHKLHGVLGLQVRIQSPDHAPDVLRARVRDWLASYRKELAGTTEEQLSQFKASLSSRIAEPPKSLAGAASRAWHPIFNRTYTFDRPAAKLAALESVAVSDLVNFYDLHVLPPLERGTEGGDCGGPGLSGSRSVVVEVWGANRVPDGDQGGVVSVRDDAGRASLHKLLSVFPDRYGA